MLNHQGNHMNRSATFGAKADHASRDDDAKAGQDPAEAQAPAEGPGSGHRSKPFGFGIRTRWFIGVVLGVLIVFLTCRCSLHRLGRRLPVNGRSKEGGDDEKDDMRTKDDATAEKDKEVFHVEEASGNAIFKDPADPNNFWCRYQQPERLNVMLREMFQRMRETMGKCNAKQMNKLVEDAKRSGELKELLVESITQKYKDVFRPKQPLHETHDMENVTFVVIPYSEMYNGTVYHEHPNPMGGIFSTTATGFDDRFGTHPTPGRRSRTCEAENISDREATLIDGTEIHAGTAGRTVIFGSNTNHVVFKDRPGTPMPRLMDAIVNVTRVAILVEFKPLKWYTEKLKAEAAAADTGAKLVT